MLKATASASALFLVALPVLAQDACTGTESETLVDPCIVGFWVGDSSSADVIRNLVRRLESSSFDRATIPPIPAALGLIVGEDGGYLTMGFSETIAWTDTNEEDSIISAMTLVGAPQGGYLSTAGAAMTFCTSFEGTAWLEMETESALAGRREATLPVTGSGGGFRPTMTYTCSANAYLQIRVDLPPPVGPIEYRLSNVGAGAFSEYFTAAQLERFRAYDPPAEAPAADDPEPVTPVEVIPGGIEPVVPEEVPIPSD